MWEFFLRSIEVLQVTMTNDPLWSCGGRAGDATHGACLYLARALANRHMEVEEWVEVHGWLHWLLHLGSKSFSFLELPEGHWLWWRGERGRCQSLVEHPSSPLRWSGFKILSYKQEPCADRQMSGTGTEVSGGQGILAFQTMLTTLLEFTELSHGWALAGRTLLPG
jgi:hypothetical protein